MFALLLVESTLELFVSRFSIFGAPQGTALIIRIFVFYEGLLAEAALAETSIAKRVTKMV